jgi:large subunit ribosomal protein L5
MHFLEKYYHHIIKYELINKFNYNSTKNLPKLKTIILNFGCKTADIRQLASCLLALELITQQKGCLTKTKYSKILFKIRKGNPTGCKVTLAKFNKFKFLELLIIEIFPKLKNFNGLDLKGLKRNNNFSYKLDNIYIFSELEKNYYLFNNIPQLDISLSILPSNSSKKNEELHFLFKAYQLPLKN